MVAHAVAYIRASSDCNAGEEKGSYNREIQVVKAHAKQNDTVISSNACFYDKVSGNAPP